MRPDALEGLRAAIGSCDPDSAESCARQAVDEGIDPVQALDAMTEAIRLVGDAFGRGERWLPDLVGAADAMQRAGPILERELERRGKQRSSIGTIVAGTVVGDIHSIGIAIVVALARAGGFRVVDLGVNVEADRFIAAVVEHNADLLAMSALLTSTAYEQEKVIKALRERGLRERVKVVVGGGAITPEFAQRIGADGYEPTATLAVELFKTLAAA